MTADAPHTAELVEAAEPEPDVTYQLLAFRFGVGMADFFPDGAEPRSEPVVLFDAVLAEAGSEDTVNARIVLAGATAAIVADEARGSAEDLLGFILAQAGVTDDTTQTNDTAEAEKGEPA